MIQTVKLILVFAKGDAFGGVLHTIKRKELPTELITNRQGNMLIILFY